MGIKAKGKLPTVEVRGRYGLSGGGGGKDCRGMLVVGCNIKACGCVVWELLYPIPAAIIFHLLPLTV